MTDRTPRARRRGPRDAGLPADDVRVGAAAGGARRAPLLELRDGVAVEGLVAEPVSNGDAPIVTGVRLDERGSRSRLTSVVAPAAGAARCPTWLAAIGADASPRGGRGHRHRLLLPLLPAARRAPSSRPGRARSAATSATSSTACSWATTGTFSITLATPDRRRRAARHLVDARGVRRDRPRLVAAQPWLDPAVSRADHRRAPHGRPAQPLARRSSSTASRSRSGSHAIGDASVCTNPLYGRGCATGFWHADLLAEALRQHPADLVAQAVALRRRARPSTSCRGTASSVTQDAEARRVAAAHPRRRGPDAANGPAGVHAGGVPRRARSRDAHRPRGAPRLLPQLQPARAARTALSDPDIGARVLAVWNERENRVPEPALGPRRPELLDVLGLAA